jgi:hypothetical protein
VSRKLKSVIIERTMGRVVRYVAEGDSCARDGFDASARALWRSAGTNYELAMRLLDLQERMIRGEIK